MSGTRTQKKLPMKSQRKSIVNYFSWDVSSMSGLKGKRVRHSPQRKWISKNRRQEVERVAESKIVPNRHVFVSILGGEIEENVEKKSRWVHIVLPLLLIFKINFSATKMNFEKPPAGDGARGWIKNSPEFACLRFHFRPINRGKGGEVQLRWVLFFHYITYFILFYLRKENEYQNNVGGMWNAWLNPK